MPVLFGSLAIAGVLNMIYNVWRSHPNEDMAKYLKAVQLESVYTKARQQAGQEAMYEKLDRTNTRVQQDFLSQAQGVKQGWISPVAAGIAGGGIGKKDMPLVRAMAARMGMDPEDLVARFDPQQSNIWLPENERGAGIPPSAKQLAKVAAGPVTPAQLTPEGGFGGE